MSHFICLDGCHFYVVLIWNLSIAIEKRISRFTFTYGDIEWEITNKFVGARHVDRGCRNIIGCCRRHGEGFARNLGMWSRDCLYVNMFTSPLNFHTQCLSYVLMVLLISMHWIYRHCGFQQDFFYVDHNTTCLFFGDFNEYADECVLLAAIWKTYVLPLDKKGVTFFNLMPFRHTSYKRCDSSGIRADLETCW